MYRFRRFATHLRPPVRGWALLDALIALTVLSLGVMALIRLQIQMHVDGRNANHRAIALHLISDLHNRMLLNLDAARSQSYALAWNAPVTATATGCDDAPCNGQALAQSDLERWVNTVRSSLPAGKARIFHAPDNPRQIGVMVAWEQTDPLEQSSTSTPNDPNNPNACPTNTLCQLSYVEI
jgi:type IV pilus assembly protein PilV